MEKSDPQTQTYREGSNCNGDREPHETFLCVDDSGSAVTQLEAPFSLAKSTARCRLRGRRDLRSAASDDWFAR